MHSLPLPQSSLQWPWRDSLLLATSSWRATMKHLPIHLKHLQTLLNFTNSLSIYAKHRRQRSRSTFFCFTLYPYMRGISVIIWFFKLVLDMRIKMVCLFGNNANFQKYYYMDKLTYGYRNVNSKYMVHKSRSSNIIKDRHVGVTKA